MIVGGGMMAQAFCTFREDRTVLVFASGVSNSLETRPTAFLREERLLREARERHPDALVLYFGTCSVHDPEQRDTPYVAHKLAMESILEGATGPWMVLRLPLAIGPGHRGGALAQFLYDRIRLGQPFEVWEHATRYPIDVADVVRIARRFLSDSRLWGRRIEIALRAYPVLDFVRIMESIIGRRAEYRLLPKGRHFAVYCPELSAISGDLDVNADDGYLERVLRKYYSRPSATP